MNEDFPLLRRYWIHIKRKKIEFNKDDIYTIQVNYMFYTVFSFVFISNCDQI